MTDSLIKIIREILSLGENVFGVLFTPYGTYFRISTYKNIYQGFFLLMIMLLLLRKGPVVAFLLAIGGIILVGMAFRKKVNIRAVFNLWAFSYIPTYLWFSVTAFLYYLLPPPRQFTSLGAIFSVVFISFSLFLFLWKLLLYYLTLRIGLKLNLYEIIAASLVLFPLLGIFSLLSYQFGVFRVPFV